MEQSKFSRRAVLQWGASLVASFSINPLRTVTAQQTSLETLPGSLRRQPMLDAWIRISDQGTVTLFTGKVEFGQGIKTSLVQLAAEELAVSPSSIEIVTADTLLTPDEVYTAGSYSIEDSGTAILNAAAQVREALVEAAAAKWLLPSDQLVAKDGFVASADGRRIGYGDLVGQAPLHNTARTKSRLIEPSQYRIVGTSFPRLDIPAKVTGGEAFVQDLRFPGMLHARVVRPPSYGAQLLSLPMDQAEGLPGVVKVVRDGNFIAVAAEGEYQAIIAMQFLQEHSTWDERESPRLPDDVFAYLTEQPAESETILDRMPSASSRTTSLFSATYRRSYQMHGSIGPSCAIALFSPGSITVWTHSQGVYPLRSAIARMLGLAEEHVRCIHKEGSGCYGHNGADDAAADASIIAQAIPGRHIRVQWMREQEHSWEPYGPAMITTVAAKLGPHGQVSDWEYSVRSNTHITRPSKAGNLMPSWHLQKPQPVPPPFKTRQPDGGGDRNAIPLYNFARAKVVHHFVHEMPLRVSALRSLGAYANVFTIESAMDHLSKMAGVDPVEFRLRHLDDERARDVVKLAALKFNWARRPQSSGKGCGIAFARYKNHGSYAAIAVELSIDRKTKKIRVTRVICAFDGGQIVNPDGTRNQIEGGILQSLSWTLYEKVEFDSRRVTSRSWATYPIMRFSAVPDHIEVHIVDRLGYPSLGAGEVAQGPTAAAFANALTAATGKRMTELPLSWKSVTAEHPVPALL